MTLKFIFLCNVILKSDKSKEHIFKNTIYSGTFYGTFRTFFHEVNYVPFFLKLSITHDY
jgi:hypothetical protein